VDDHSRTVRLLVIGVGNDLRRDDGAGRAVVDELVRRDVAGIQAVWSHQLVPELVEVLADAERVVFVDAALPLQPRPDATTPDAGVLIRRVDPADAAFGGHRADPAALLGLARLAGLTAPPAYLVSLPTYDLGLGDELSAGTRAAVEQAVEAILALSAKGSGAPGAVPTAEGA
jgi:hydrogenase maturation protease